jgi:tyrosinase
MTIRHNILENSTAAAQFITGVQRMKDPNLMPWPGQDGLSMYDFFIFWHHRAMMLATPPSQSSRNAAHSGPVFLPWHRYMLLMFEFYLQDAVEDDSFRLPYWDSAADAELADPRSSNLWSDEILGQFTNGDWRVRLEPNPTGRNPRIVDRPLQRELGLSGSMATPAQVQDLIRTQAVYDMEPYTMQVDGFRNHLEGWDGVGHHNLVHIWIGGDMAVSTSPNDPAFFLHHCNVDRIWAAWQQRYPNADYVPNQSAAADYQFHRLDDAMHTFFNHDADITPRTMLDASQWYRYDALDDLLAN